MATAFYFEAPKKKLANELEYSNQILIIIEKQNARSIQVAWTHLGWNGFLGFSGLLHTILDFPEKNPCDTDAQVSV